MIISKLGVIMADRNMSVNELAERVGITPINITRIRTGKVKGVRFGTLDAICEVLKCQPGDIFIYVKDGEDARLASGAKVEADDFNFQIMERED